MIFTGNEQDTAIVADFFNTRARSAADVNRPISAQDTLVIYVATLVTGLANVENRIAALEAQLAELTQRKKLT